MILCVPRYVPIAPGLGGCPDGYEPIQVGNAEAGPSGFQALQLQPELAGGCSGFLCAMPVQDIAFAGFVVVAFAIGFAAGFMRR